MASSSMTGRDAFDQFTSVEKSFQNFTQHFYTVIKRLAFKNES